VNPFGIELPKEFPTEVAPEVSSAPQEATDNAPTVAKEPSTPEATQLDKPKTPELVDIDKLERFRFQGRELTPKELMERQMMRDDYTRKSQQVAEARKYADNFETDLAWVLEDPTRLGKMKEVYPPQYVKIAEKILSRIPTEHAQVPGQPQASPEPRTAALPPEVVREIEEIREWKSQVQSEISAAKQAKADAELTSWFDEFGKKFSEADNEVVTAKAQLLAESLEENGKQFTKAHLERLFKEDHEMREKRFMERVRAQQKEQKAVAKQSQDIGGGGGVPGTAPKQAKTFKEARELFDSDMKSGRLS